MWREIVTLLVTPALGLLLTWATLRAAKHRDQRAGDNADGRLDLDVIKETVETLVDEVSRLKTDLTEEREARATAELRAREAEQRALVAEQRARDARRVTTRLMRRVQQLETALRSAHIDVPAEQPHDLEPDLD